MTRRRLTLDGLAGRFWRCILPLPCLFGWLLLFFVILLHSLARRLRSLPTRKDFLVG